LNLYEQELAAIDGQADMARADLAAGEAVVEAAALNLYEQELAAIDGQADMARADLAAGEAVVEAEAPGTDLPLFAA
jgi:hypothetical protein